jgi:DNA-binding transcriptional MocR family regulator
VLIEQLGRHHPMMVYTIPSFHNPGGQTLSHERRIELAELSREHDFLVVADEVYQLLHYFKEPPPALGTMTDLGHILSLGSFSKIMAPGLRLGWIQTSSDLMERLLGTGVVNSGGSFNHFTSHVVRHAIEMGLQQELLEKLRATYRRRVETMDAALHEHLDGLASWQRPDGGYFFWLQLNPGADAGALRKLAADYRTGFHYGEDDIREGIARLGRLLKDNP